ncbi:hypothetical protein [Sporichthya sp.]|uniref:hypothetical protein n=1 Tax=Sporichthya sp. TaxID=65475 RepID=UPI00345C6115
MASMGGQFLVGVAAEHRAAAGVAAGEVLEVDLELDNAPREVEEAWAAATRERRIAKAVEGCARKDSLTTLYGSGL